ncbi:hypothetical protein SF1_06520 [Sphingobacterium faecium NBRC 15299]|jgi:hypothetical protein|uniref:lysylphosphatidylglycerol synthase domain-containing protein n=1 Tax=Sphingobacterium faecium TaxID=34087 RepID=UPI000D3F653F|nr:lysylphosphatidylglycerol synthase domain-containing protein [Sphingobacterium faecium]PTX10793.1 hypothetical protein C8N37_10472 [Sphingobacterium faecium]UZJ64847.1 hypothetical protein OKW96_00495 [Sphingobacterium sp. KU25419]GEM62670.1 hypothetical protein SF1_06520 [Sphingobacterium faecium NBRC 15299]
MLTKAQKKYSGVLIKIAVLAFAGWYIYKQLSDPNNLLKFKTLIDGIDPHYFWLTFSLIVFLMFVNWMLEVVKWQYLAIRIEKISLGKAFQSVFSGLTWAIFTPNRIGEYGGRVLFLKPENRAKGAVAMGVGLFAQLVLTSIAGALSIAWFACTYLETPLSIGFGIWLLAILYATGFLVLYFNVHWVDIIVGKIGFLKRIKPFFSILEEYTFKELLVVILISLARFIIFTSQYIILMLVILPELPVMAMILMIFILFFVQAALPTLDIFDFSVRSFVAGNLYSYITNQELAVMAIVSCIWFVNLILPAFLGSFFVLKINFFGDSKS